MPEDRTEPGSATSTLRPATRRFRAKFAPWGQTRSYFAIAYQTRQLNPKMRLPISRVALDQKVEESNPSSPANIDLIA